MRSRYLSGVKSDRMVIVVSGYPSIPNPKILGIPEIARSTGADQCKAIMTVLKRWECSDILIWIVFDTTASNTGKAKGSCIAIEQCLDKALLWFACRHHVYEKHIKHVADKLSAAKNPHQIFFS